MSEAHEAVGHVGVTITARQGELQEPQVLVSEAHEAVGHVGVTITARQGKA